MSRDRRDPSSWQALVLDPSQSIERSALEAIADNQQSWSRSFLLPLLRWPCRALTWIFSGLRSFIPARLNGSGVLHWMIAKSATGVLRPSAVLMLHRHFHIGDQVLAFLLKNLGLENQAEQLASHDAHDLLDHIFVKHDLNLYNCLLDIGEAVAGGQGRLGPKPLDELDFSMIDNGFEANIKLPTPSPIRFWDLESAIEAFTPMFALLLPKADFMRASHSLQFDESVAAMIGQLLGMPFASAMVNNRQPLLPESTVRTGRRLMMHGIDTERLYGTLLQLKARQAATRSSA